MLLCLLAFDMLPILPHNPPAFPSEFPKLSSGVTCDWDCIVTYTPLCLTLFTRCMLTSSCFLQGVGLVLPNAAPVDVDCPLSRLLLLLLASTDVTSFIFSLSSCVMCTALCYCLCMLYLTTGCKPNYPREALKFYLTLPYTETAFTLLQVRLP